MGIYFDKSGKPISPIKEGVFTGKVQKATRGIAFCPFPEIHIKEVFYLEIETKDGLMKIRIDPAYINMSKTSFLPRADLGMGITEEYLIGKLVGFYVPIFEGDRYSICQCLETMDFAKEEHERTLKAKNETLRRQHEFDQRRNH
jgi:hypothetical protein